MARKDIDTLRQETLAQRFEIYKLITFENHPLDRALKMVLHDSKTRKRTFTGWKEKGLWPISEEEEKLIELPTIGSQVQEVSLCEETQIESPVIEQEEVPQESYVPAPDQDIPAAPPDTTQLAPIVTQAETSAIKEVTDECVRSPQKHTTKVEQVSEKVTHDAPIDTQPIEPTSEIVTQAVPSDTQQPESVFDSSAQPSLTAFSLEDIGTIIKEMVQKEVEKAVASIGPISTETKKEISVRPLFKRDETVTRSIRISRTMAEQAESKAKADRTWTGGNLNALIEVLIWEYLDRPDELIEDES